MITFEQFSERKGISIQHVRRLASQTRYRCIHHNGEKYDVLQSGTYSNGSPRYFIVLQDEAMKKKHLKSEQREAALTMLTQLMTQNAADAISRVAMHFGVSYWSVYRLWKNPNKIERKKRADAGSTKKGVHPEAMKMFESIYIQNAQAPNVKLAYDLTCRQFPGIDMPLRYFRKRAAEIEPVRLRFHRESGFEKLYTPRVRRDLWSEFEFLECVSLDGWVVPDRVLRSTGLGHLTESKFTFSGKDVSMVCLFAVDSKTGEPLAWSAYERSINQDDVLALLLQVVERWGKPGYWLLDNGTEFTNEAVQRFLRGLYSTDEHDTKQRIVFSMPYEPYGKGRHERMHKLFKDEFCAFSRSYSPNQHESRKPTKQLSYVKPVHNLAEWCTKFESYLHGFFRERQRTSWMNPHHSPHHEINANRPRTHNEAFERAYATFTPNRVEPFRLAYLYAKKFRARLRNSLFKAPTSIGLGMKLNYLATNIPIERYSEIFEIVVNPNDLSQAWVCDLDGNFVCEAWDVRAKDAGATPTREVAAEYRKQRNRLNKLAREEAKIKSELVEMDNVFKGKVERSEVRGRKSEVSYNAPEVGTEEELDDELVQYFIQTKED